MFEFKAVFSVLAIALTFVSYVPYVLSVIKKQTKPHIYSWLVWVLDAFIIFALQITHGAGTGAFVTLASGVMCLTVLILTIYKGVKSEIKLTDTIFLILACVALVIWLFAKQPLVSALLIMSVDLLGFVPTVCKSWIKPFSETPSFYALNTLRFGLALLALRDYSMITMIYPVVWLIAEGLFTFMLLARRRLLTPSKV
jgi:hypothetical protein